jgi:hypothetical protein
MHALEKRHDWTNEVSRFDDLDERKIMLPLAELCAAS